MSQKRQRRGYFDVWLSPNFGWYFAAGRRSVVFWRGRCRRLGVERPHPGQMRLAVGRQRVTFSRLRMLHRYGSRRS